MTYGRASKVEDSGQQSRRARKSWPHVLSPEGRGVSGQAIIGRKTANSKGQVCTAPREDALARCGRASIVATTRRNWETRHMNVMLRSVDKAPDAETKAQLIS